MADEGAVCEVVRDGATAWICIVTWPDGKEFTREVGAFYLAGLPEINVASTEEEALTRLVEWVRQRPEDWR